MPEEVVDSNVQRRDTLVELAGQDGQPPVVLLTGDATEKPAQQPIEDPATNDAQSAIQSDSQEPATQDPAPKPDAATTTPAAQSATQEPATTDSPNQKSYKKRTHRIAQLFCYR